MNLNDIFDLAGALTLQVALVAALVAFFSNTIRSGRAEDKRFQAYGEERDKRDELLIAERDEWKAIAQAEQAKREESDDRLERITQAFETATSIVLRQSGGDK